jgi:hypothetical protein
VGWAGIRVTYRDMGELVFACAISGEDSLAPQGYLVAGSAHGCPGRQGAPRGSHTGSFARSPTRLATGTRQGVVVQSCSRQLLINRPHIHTITAAHVARGIKQALPAL